MDNTEKVLEVYISWFTRHKTCQTTSLASCRVSCFSFFSFPSRILVRHPLPVTAAFGLEKAAESPIPGFLALRAGEVWWSWLKRLFGLSSGEQETDTGGRDGCAGLPRGKHTFLLEVFLLCCLLFFLLSSCYFVSCFK